MSTDDAAAIVVDDSSTESQQAPKPKVADGTTSPSPEPRTPASTASSSKKKEKKKAPTNFGTAERKNIAEKCGIESGSEQEGSFLESLNNFLKGLEVVMDFGVVLINDLAASLANQDRVDKAIEQTGSHANFFKAQVVPQLVAAYGLKPTLKPAPIFDPNAEKGKKKKGKKEKGEGKDKDKKRKRAGSKDKDKKDKKKRKKDGDSKKEKKKGKDKDKKKKSKKEKDGKKKSESKKKGRVKQLVDSSSDESVVEYTEEQQAKIDALKSIREIWWNDEVPVPDRISKIKELDSGNALPSAQELQEGYDAIGPRSVGLRIKAAIDVAEQAGERKKRKKPKTPQKEKANAMNILMGGKTGRSTKKRKEAAAESEMDPELQRRLDELEARRVARMAAREEERKKKQAEKERIKEAAKQKREAERAEKKKQKEEEKKKRQEEKDRIAAEKRAKKLGLPSAKIEDTQLTDSLPLPEPEYGPNALGLDADLMRDAMYIHNFVWTFGQTIELTRFPFNMFTQALCNLHETTLLMETYRSLLAVCENDEKEDEGRRNQPRRVGNWLQELAAYLGETIGIQKKANKRLARSGKLFTGKGNRKQNKKRQAKKKANTKTAKFQCDDSSESSEGSSSEDDEEEEEEEEESEEEKSGDEEENVNDMFKHPWNEIPRKSLKNFVTYTEGLGRQAALPSYGIEDRIISLKHLVHCAIRTDAIRAAIASTPAELQKENKDFAQQRTELSAAEKAELKKLEDKGDDDKEESSDKPKPQPKGSRGRKKQQDNQDQQEEKEGGETQQKENEDGKEKETSPAPQQDGEGEKDGLKRALSPTPGGKKAPPKKRPKLSAEEKKQKEKLAEEKRQKVNEVKALYRKKMFDLVFEHHNRMEGKTFRTLRPLGEDRFRRIYWKMACGQEIYVERTDFTAKNIVEVKPKQKKTEGEKAENDIVKMEAKEEAEEKDQKTRRTSGSGVANPDEVKTEDKPETDEKKEEDGKKDEPAGDGDASGAEPVDKTWAVFETTEELIAALNDKGIRESQLLSGLKAYKWVTDYLNEKQSQQAAQQTATGHSTRSSATQQKSLKQYKNKFRTGSREPLEW
eukprot:TRINITY_DN65935_c8_g1_i1.p1 TRINITY_DN65935_c8_g1~~TRINITY_DN65935_c8_g1_i1.p1  ORF type:complete len:1083 (-),score=247.41 TRINITY_DN65935_c8_g1_i1:1490-4738(-)